MKQHAGELEAIAYQWFEAMRNGGDEVVVVHAHLMEKTATEGQLKG